MKNKICFITGANSGIGKAAAVQLAKAGFYILLGSRNEQRGLAAVSEVKEQSGSRAVELIIIDLSSKASIEKAATNIKEKFNKLDVLIHNAADFDLARKEPVPNEDGIETVWMTNHIGPVLLTNQLLILLKNSKQGRVITVASKGLQIHPRLTVDLEDPEFKNRKFSVPAAYYQSKLAQVMYTYWLAEKLSNTPITVNCIRVTNVKIDLERYPHLSGFMKFLYSIKSRFSISPEEMAETYTYVATSPDLDQVTGQYFDEKNKMVSSSTYSRKRENIDQVMKLTLGYIY